MKRKDFLKGSAVMLGAGLLPAHLSASPLPKKSIRFAHITDIHLKPGAIPEAGMAKVLQQIQEIKPGVDFIFNGGDSIMDALEADKQKTAIQWELFTNVLQKENQLPIYHAIGNHDIWGWFAKTDKPVNDPLYGKQWVLEKLKLPGRYYSFKRDNWHFIVLDSTQLNPAGGYIGKLDEEQMNWLQHELADIPPAQFICIISHIPVLSVCSGLFFDKTEANGDLLVKRNLMHTDFLTLKKLFLKYPNIRLCLSGHTHLQDEVHYLGISYFCNGAVSGNWWSGAFQEFDPAYALIELFADGTFKRTIVHYS